MDFRAVGIAAFGGFLLNMMNLWDDSRKPKSDRAPKDGLYLLFFVAWPVIGAALAYVYLLDRSQLRPLLALSVGLGAPTTIRSLMSTAIHPSGPPGGAEP